MRLASLRSSLDTVEARWANETDAVMGTCLAKLYCLECCGWIEQWVDEMVITYGYRKIGCSNHRKVLLDSVKRIHGFSFDEHIRPLLIDLAGLRTVCILEDKMDQTVLLQLKASLSNLKSYRDRLAHTTTVGVQVQLPAPSTCRAELSTVVRGLLHMRRTLRSLV